MTLVVTNNLNNEKIKVIRSIGKFKTVSPEAILNNYIALSNKYTHIILEEHLGKHIKEFMIATQPKSLIRVLVLHRDKDRYFLV